MAGGLLSGLLGGGVSGALIGTLIAPGIGTMIGAGIGAAVGGGMGYWVDQLPVPEAPQIEKRSPNYGWDTARNAAGSETPVFVAYGVPQVHGSVVYQGGEAKTTKTTGAVEYVDPAEVMDFCVAWGEGPILDLYKVTADEVDLADIAGAGARHYLGTAAQEPDERFATVRNRVEFSTPDWYTFDPDHPADTPTQKIFTFTPAENGATAKLHAQWAAATEDSDRTKFAFFRLEYRPNGESLWTDAGVYEIRATKSQLGVVDVQIPVGDPTGSDPLTVSVTEHWEQTITETADGYYTESTLVTQPQTVQKTTGVRYRTFAGGVAHELRVTYVRISAGSALVPEDSDFVSATLRFPDMEVVERLGAQAFRNTAYSALTLPRKGLQSSQPKLAARVVGRVVEVWTGAAFVERWSNNPIWCLRDLIRSTRYGLALPSVPYAGTSDAEWGGFRMAAAACDALVGTVQASAAVTTYAAGPPVTVVCATWPTETDFAGYVLENQAGQTALIYRHDQADRKVYLVAAFGTAPTSVTVKEQRFRLDLVLDTQRSAEEQVRQILTHCRGLYWEDAGSLRVAVEMPRASAGEIDVDAIVENSFEAWEERDDDLPDTLIARYIDPDQSFAKREVVLGTNAEGGRVDEREWLGCLNVRQAQRLGWFVERIANLPRRCRFATSLSTIAYEPGDVVTVYHPVGGVDYGYDIADPDAPVKTANGREVVILSIRDDPQNDTRTHLCREYAAEAYSDAPGLGLPARLRDGRAFQVPDPVTDLTLSSLGDLTPDGIWNPEVQAEWVQPNRGAVAGWAVYESLDEGVTWRQVGAPSIPVFGWKLLGFSGTLYVKVVPVGGHGLLGSFADALTATLSIVHDTTAPAIPTGLLVSYTDRLSIYWTAAAEKDFDHYLCSVDDWATSWVVRRHNAEVLNPSIRGLTFRVKAVDRSGNASGEASIWCYLPEPPAPGIAYLLAEHEWNVVRLSVAEGQTPGLGHKGWHFRMSFNGADWTALNANPSELCTFVVPWSDFAGLTTEIYVQYAEVDVFGPGAWSVSKSVTLTKPLADEISETLGRKWAAEAGATNDGVWRHALDPSKIDGQYVYDRTIGQQAIAFNAIVTENLDVRAWNRVFNWTTEPDDPIPGWTPAPYRSTDTKGGEVVRVADTNNLIVSDAFRIDPSRAYSLKISGKNITNDDYQYIGFRFYLDDNGAKGAGIEPWAYETATAPADREWVREPYYWVWGAEISSPGHGWRDYELHIQPHDADATRSPDGTGATKTVKTPENAAWLEVTLWGDGAGYHRWFNPAFRDVEGGVIIANRVQAATLAALVAYLGGVTIDSNGYLRCGKTSYADTTGGFWIGNDGGTAKLVIGDATKSVDWDGSALTVNGELIATGNLITGASHAQVCDYTASGQAASWDSSNPSTLATTAAQELTPSATTDKVLVEFSAAVSAIVTGVASGDTCTLNVSLQRSTDGGAKWADTSWGTGWFGHQTVQAYGTSIDDSRDLVIRYLDAPATTSALCYRVRVYASLSGSYSVRQVTIFKRALTVTILKKTGTG